MDKIIQNLDNWIGGTPKTIVNAGIGPLKKNNQEANIFKSEYPHINIIGFEPNYNLFANRFNEYPGKLYPFALWDKTEFKTMFIDKHGGQSSILQCTTRWREKYKTSLAKEVVSCVSIDDLYGKIIFDDNIFLWLDVEGSELKALNGAKNTLTTDKMKWICVEVSTADKRIGEPSEENISSFLWDYGFSATKRYEYSESSYNILYTSG